MSEVVSAFLLTFAGLFPIVNPLESVPFYLTLTRSLAVAERNKMAGRVAANGTALLLGSMLLGPWLLEVFGIQLPVVRIAGGLVILALGWKLLTQDEWSDHDATNVAHESHSPKNSFYPLTMPLTVGPGSMSVAIAIGSRKPPNGFHLATMALYGFGAVAGLLAIGLSIFLAYRFSTNIARVLGSTGIEVLVRLSSFILMCIGIEFIWNGYTTLIALHGN